MRHKRKLSPMGDVKQVIKAANTIDGKVSLVGHSSDGVIISQAAEFLGTEKIDKLIYLDAFVFTQ